MGPAAEGSDDDNNDSDFVRTATEKSSVFRLWPLDSDRHPLPSPSSPHPFRPSSPGTLHSSSTAKESTRHSGFPPLDNTVSSLIK